MNEDLLRIHEDLPNLLSQDSLDSSGKMSSGEVRKVSRQDIQLVQNLIECCLQLYMNKKEVVDTLSLQAKIEPSFTELVWKKLQEENQEFFKAYHVRLMLKNQILVFNKLLERQVELMRKACPSGAASAPISNGSTSVLHQTPPSCYLSEKAAPSTRPDHMFSNGISSSSFANGKPLGQERNHIGNNSSLPTGSMDTSPSMLSTQISYIARTGEINESTIKTEPIYPSNSNIPFGGDNSFLEVRQPIADISTESFSNSEFTGQQLNDPLLDIDTSFGFGQIPRNFSFSDLTDDFMQCADILESYGRSPFLPRANNFENSPGREFHEDENPRLDTISEGVSYEDFGSD